MVRVLSDSRYVLSIAFHGTVVLIEGTSTPRAALPVRERNVYVNTFRQPFIERVTSAAGLSQPITATSTLRITGTRLRGAATAVRIGQTEVTPATGDVSDTQIDVVLPPGLRAGIQSVQVVHPALMGSPLASHSGVELNAVPFVLQPAITVSVSGVTPTIEDGSPLVVNGITLQSATATVAFTPRVWQGCSVSSCCCTNPVHLKDVRHVRIHSTRRLLTGSLDPDQARHGVRSPLQ